MIEVSKSKFFQPLWLLLSLFLICCLIACGGSTDTADTGGDTPTVTAASLDLVASPPTVKSDGTTTSTITVTAKNSNNATLSGIAITMSADSGNIGPNNITTGDDGTAKATFSSGSNAINRTATITATAGSVSSRVQVEVVDSTVTLSSTGSSLTTSGTDSITLTVTAKDSNDYGINGAEVLLTQSSTNGGSVTFASSSGTTSTVDSVRGVFKTTVTGSTAGKVTIIARALGASASTSVTVATAAESFAIDGQWLNSTDIGNPDPSAMQIGDNLQIRVNVPSTVSNVTFSTTVGSWVGGSGTWIKVPAAGTPPNRKASAILNTTSPGIADVMAYDTANISTQDTMKVYMTSQAAPHSIMLQASPTVVSRKTATTTGTSTILATVRDSSNFVVANQPVSFSIVNPTGGGETISPAVVQTGFNGEASTTFTAGTMTSYDAGGVKIHAEVIGTTVKTGVSPSGNDASVVIGGKPASIAFGRATVLGTTGGTSNYVQAMSVLVTDINGNPVQGAKVSLSAWPIAWSTGVQANCAYDPDNGTDQGTFLNEDVNENTIKDYYGNPYWSGNPPPYDEDGLRLYYNGGTKATSHGTPDGYLTPKNTEGGSVDAIVTTDASGLATFNLIYAKQNAIWTITRIRASTIVQGSETVGQTIFRLPCTEDDCGASCRLNCPYRF